MSVPNVAGYAGEICAGDISGVPSLLFRGRFHLYQGLSAWASVATARALAGTSVRALVVLNAAGGLDPDFQVGDIMLMTDRIYMPGFSGVSPFIPPPLGGVRFVSMRGAYCPALRDVMLSAAAEVDVDLKQGVYGLVAGPVYESDAESRMRRFAVSDAVGMSTVHEVLMARSLGLDIAGLSLITNRAIPGETTEPSHEEVLRVSGTAIGSLAVLLEEFA